MREDITLYGDRAEQFRELQDQIEDRENHGVSKSQVVEKLMNEYEESQGPLTTL